jgi:hypothetical protein
MILDIFGQSDRGRLEVSGVWMYLCLGKTPLRR